jgi:aspartate/methionine/tyrosine aminotransferase
MEEAKRRHKLIILLNFPNNPTGYTISPSEGEGIADILTRAAQGGTNIIAVVDDAYFGLVYEDNVLRESISSILIGRDPRLLTIKLDGATKESYAWGLRVGFITYGASFGGQPRPLYDALERKTGGDIRGSISNASHLSQSIILKSLTAGTFASEKMEKYKIMKDRVQELKHVLMDTKYDKIWKMYPFNSGYFMCLQLKTVEAEPLRVHLLDKYGVGLISLGKTDLRVAFSCIEKENIRDLFDTIYNGIKDLE